MIYGGTHHSRLRAAQCLEVLAPDVDDGQGYKRAESLLPSWLRFSLVLPPLNMTDHAPDKEEAPLLPADPLETSEDGPRRSVFPCWLVMPQMQKRRVKGEERRTVARRNSGV